MTAQVGASDIGQIALGGGVRLVDEIAKISAGLIVFFSAFFWLVGIARINDTYRYFGASAYALEKGPLDYTYYGFRSIALAPSWIVIPIWIVITISIAAVLKRDWVRLAIIRWKMLFIALVASVPLISMVYVP